MQRISLTLATLALLATNTATATQVVFLDFDTGSDGSIVYTAAMRANIQAAMANDYAQFDFSIVQTAPVSGDYSTISFNTGGSGGLADAIDFLNQNQNDNAVVNVDGFGLVTTADIESASAIIGSHELGHLQGMRHYDSWGPIGSGISAVPGPVPFLPDYPGPVNANETPDHIMASPASVGSTLGDLTTPSWFSERSAIKLSNNEQGTVQNEAGAVTPLAFDNLNVPNTIESGDNAGETFIVKAFTAFGSLDNTQGDIIDAYTFDAQAGDIFSFEVISGVLGLGLDPDLTILDSGGAAVDYYGTAAFNDDEFESFDSIIVDLIFTVTDTYTIEVGMFGDTGVGDYYLYGYSLATAVNGVPAPAAIFLMLVGLMGMRRSRVR